MAENESLDRSFEFYLENQADLVEQYNGKFIVIKDAKVVGVFDDEITAVTESEEKFPQGSFLVQHVTHGKDEYTEIFHSRAAFNWTLVSHPPPLPSGQTKDYLDLW